MSLIASNQMARNKNINVRSYNYYPSSSIVKKTENITSAQGYDNYYGKASVQKDSKNTNTTLAGYLHNPPQNLSKESGMLPKLSNTNLDKKQEERARILYSRQKATRRDDNYPPTLITQSQIKKSDNYNIKTITRNKESQSSLSYLKQMTEDKETSYKPSKQELDSIYKTKSVALVGLNNIGNTCFMNSILQCMLNLPKFNDYFMNNQHHKESNSSSKVAYAYGRLVQMMKTSTSRSETPSQLKSAVAVKKNRFSGYGQQDAQQFLLALLQLLSIELNRSKNPKYKELKADLSTHSLQQISQQWWNYNKQRQNSVICDYFAGQILSKVICTFDNTWDFALTFSHNDNGQILKMVENFLKEEVISEDYYCSKCKKFRECTRKIFLYRLPQILVLQIKRFSYGKYSKQKLNNRIRVPCNLNLSKAIVYSHHESAKNPIYELVGVVNHSGQINYGHYTAECKNPINGRWYNFNDSSVNETSVGDTIQSSSPYLLFYSKK